MGKKQPMKIRAILDASPMPSSTIISGNSASFGVGKMAEISGSTNNSITRERPFRMPSVMPTTAARQKPVPARAKL